MEEIINILVLIFQSQFPVKTKETIGEQCASMATAPAVGGASSMTVDAMTARNAVSRQVSWDEKLLFLSNNDFLQEYFSFPIKLLNETKLCIVQNNM